MSPVFEKEGKSLHTDYDPLVKVKLPGGKEGMLFPNSTVTVDVTRQPV